jgi:hypothetical protein
LTEILSNFGNPATINAISDIILIGRGPNSSNFLGVISLREKRLISPGG